jgi:hypothetical protein
MENTDKIFTLKLTEIDVDGGSVPVTWCLSPEWLDNHDISQYWVLFSTCQPQPGGENAEWRGCCKLSEMMAYVTFFRPGINRIFATITPNHDRITHWMSRDNGQWVSSVISFPTRWTEPEKIDTWNYRLFSGGAECDDIQIDLPKDCFAKEPLEIEKVWVNWLWRNKAVDQCEFRRRRMFAYSIQPILFLVLFLSRIIAALACLSIGCKGIGWAPIFKPLYYSTTDIVTEISGSYFTIKKLPNIGRFMFVPMVPLALIGAAFGLIANFNPILTALCFAVFIPVLCVIGLAFSFVFFIGNFIKFEKIFDYLFDRIGDYTESRSEAKEQALNEWNCQQRELMMCSNAKVIRKLSDLPKSKRTIKLRFYGLKSLVCRPFAK